MVRAIPQPKLTPADDLRDKLQRAELIVANLQGMGPQAATLLGLLDEAQDLLISLEAQGMDVRAERTRLITVQNQLRSRAALLNREMAAVGGFPALREKRSPPRDHWWWYLDELVAQRRRQLLRHGIIIGAVVLILLAVVGVVYNRYLAPDPLTRQMMALFSEAEALLEQGDFPGALAKYQAVLDLAPTNTEALIWTGVLAQQLGQEERAEVAFAAARTEAGSELRFLIGRGMAYVQLNQLDAAQTDTEAALALDPNSAEAHFLLGGVYELQGRSQEAIAELQRAADLARQSGNNPLYVLISTRLAMLLQTAGLSSGGE